MIRYLTHPDGLFWRARAVDDYVEIRQGKIGDEGELSVVETYEEFGVPPEYSLDRLAEDLFEAGYASTPIPEVHLEIEQAHGIALPEPIRSFFADGTYLEYQGKVCQKLRCGVDFVTDAVLGNYMQEHYDRERGAEREFVPISGVIHNDAPDEQAWIGIDPAEAGSAVYALYTSGAFDLEYPDFAAFLADLTSDAG